MDWGGGVPESPQECAMTRNEAVRTGRAEATSKDRLWPTLIVIGLSLVILVNLTFIYVAVSGADDVVPSYQTEER
jgi:hypothetical protein